MASIKQEKLQLYEVLKQRHRKLGEANELVLFGQGPGCAMRLVFGILVLICSFIGVFRGLGDCLITLAPSTRTGLVTLVDYANAEINERELYRVHFEVTNDGRVRSAYSYTTASTPSEGSEVQIQYCAFMPRLMRVEGMKMSVFGSIGFLIIGLIVFCFGWAGWSGFRRALRWRHLLCDGTPGWAQLTSKEPTNVSINEQTVYKLTFTYESGPNTSHTLEVNEHRSEELRALQDEGQELMLYDPNEPAFGVLWDQLPCKLKLDRNGVFRSPRRGDLITSIVVILITIGSLFVGFSEFYRLFRGG